MTESIGLFERAWDAAQRPQDEDILIRALLTFSLRTKIDDLLPMVEPEDFASPIRGHIWTLARKLRERNSYVNKPNLEGANAEFNADQLMTPARQIEGVLRQNEGFSIVFSEAKRAAELVAEVADRRRLVESVRGSMERLLRGGEFGVYANAMDDLYEQLGKLQTDSSKLDGSSFSEAIEAWWDQVESGPRSSIPTPWYELNEVLPGRGALGGQFNVIGARPSVGKSVALSNIAQTAANFGKKVLFISLEMPRFEVTSRMVANGANVQLTHIVNHELTDLDKEKIAAWQERSQAIPLDIITKPGIRLSEVRAEAKTRLRTTGLDMIVIDYLQIMGTGKSESRLQALSELTLGIKQLALELDIPIWVACQLRRPTDGNPKAAPNMSQIRESGTIEQDADIVILLNRDTENAECDEIELLLVKNRNGQTRPFRFFWHGIFSRIGIPE